MAERAGQIRRASEALRMATAGDPSRSVDRNGRPWRSEIPRVSKYEGSAVLKRATEESLSGDCAWPGTEKNQSLQSETPGGQSTAPTEMTPGIRRTWGRSPWK